jgi:hypothetical protein
VRVSPEVVSANQTVAAGGTNREFKKYAHDIQR